MMDFVFWQITKLWNFVTPLYYLASLNPLYELFVKQKNFIISDIDECFEDSHGCHADAICHNTQGSYNCTCPSGKLCHNIRGGLFFLIELILCVSGLIGMAKTVWRRVFMSSKNVKLPYMECSFYLKNIAIN